MAKRGNGEGSISRRKGGGWVAQYYTNMGGVRKRRTLYARTRQEAATKLAKAIADRDGGLVVDAGALTVGKYLERWLKDSVKDTIKTSTYTSYSQMVRKHMIPSLEEIKLKSLTPAHIRGLLREKLDDEYSTRTVQYLRFLIRKAMDQAIQDHLIALNPVAGVKSVQVIHEEIQPLSPFQARLLLETIKGDRLEALYVLAIHCGLRQGELLALKWEDVDLDATTPTLQVRRTLTGSEDGRPIFTTPKTKKSRRRINLTKGAAAALKRHRKHQLEQRMKVAGLWQDHGLIFSTQNGTAIDRHNLIRRSFKPLLKTAALPEDIRFHDLRHTCATLLLSRGVHPKFVQELLGHSSIAITLDTYSHVLPGMDSGLGDAMDDALG